MAASAPGAAAASAARVGAHGGLARRLRQRGDGLAEGAAVVAGLRLGEAEVVARHPIERRGVDPRPQRVARRRRGGGLGAVRSASARAITSSDAVAAVASTAAAGRAARRARRRRGGVHSARACAHHSAGRLWPRA